MWIDNNEPDIYINDEEYIKLKIIEVALDDMIRVAHYDDHNNCLYFLHRNGLQYLIEGNVVILKSNNLCKN